MSKSIDFYTRVMGMKLLFCSKGVNLRAAKHFGHTGQPGDGKLEIAYLYDQRGSKIELTYYPEQTQFINPPFEEQLFDHLSFEVDDLESLLDIFRKMNLEIEFEPYEIGMGTKLAWAKDPDGVVFELFQYSPQMKKMMNPIPAPAPKT